MVCGDCLIAVGFVVGVRSWALAATDRTVLKSLATTSATDAIEAWAYRRNDAAVNPKPLT